MGLLPLPSRQLDAIHLLCLIAYACIVPCGGSVGYCLQQAHHLPLDAGTWRQGAPVPPAQPALAASDWPAGALADEQHMTNTTATCHPEAPIYRYKVLGGVVHVPESDAHNMSAYSSALGGRAPPLGGWVWGCGRRGRGPGQPVCTYSLPRPSRQQLHCCPAPRHRAPLPRLPSPPLLRSLPCWVC